MERLGRMFDVENLAIKLNIEHDVLLRIINEARLEFPDDQMMMELHVVRALRMSHRKDMQ